MGYTSLLHINKIFIKKIKILEKISFSLKNLELSEIMLIFVSVKDIAESLPLPAAIGSNESLALDRVGEDITLYKNCP